MSRLPVADARATTRLGWTLLRERRGIALLCLLAFTVEALAGLVGPLALGRIVDLVGTGGEPGDLAAPVLAVVGAALVAAAAGLAAVALLARVAEPALAGLRERVLDRAVHLEPEVVEEAGDGDLLSRVGDDARLVGSIVGEAVPLLVGSALAVAVTAGGLFVLDWRLGLAGLATLPLYVLGLRWYLPRSGPYYRREREAGGVRAEELMLGMHAAGTLRAHGLEERQRARIAEASWRSAQIAIDVYVLLTRFWARNNRAELIGLLLIVATGFWLVRSDEVTLGAVTTAALFFHRLFNPIGALLSLFDQVQSAGASLVRLAGIALLPSVPTPPTSTPGPGALVARGLRHEYVAGRPVLHDLDLDLAAGERVAIVGASGAGKTTLGAILAGRLRPTDGHVALDGLDVDDLVRGERPRVALVTQDVHVFHGTLRDDLTLARPDADEALLENVLRRVGALRAVAGLPAGLDTVVGEGADPLPPALVQQLALARVHLLDPTLVVLDEAGAEAGASGVRDLEGALEAVTAGRTSITIAHRLDQAVPADRILVMDAGHVAEQGTHDQLLAAGGRYARLWSVWSA
ncbi:ABC transporter ATP-binding protein [Alteromonas gracilis]